SCSVLQARQVSDKPQAPFAPAPIEEVVAAIKQEKPEMVFAPHVETASGIILPNDYIKAVAEATHEVGGLFVLDCIASGTVWVDMNACGVDVLISAPQKGWSSSPCSGLVVLSKAATQKLDETQSNSFACDLKKWFQIMQAYENGGHAYHATMPTDALKQFRDTMMESKKLGFAKLKESQLTLGAQVRELFATNGFQSVAADGFGAPGVAVFYTDKPDMQTGKPFKGEGLQIAAGVPLQCDEPAEFKTFRIGLFGIDKLMNIDRTVATLKEALAKIQ
ncbi:MAG: aminotransferase class V-fold PLP-dependent enzyme, partial [Pseudomonadales bacterium]|nr:aminotransferase class V-fold PLP-dependent enzyme [Pseudomonadales bacterium]